MAILDDFQNGISNLYGAGGPGDPLIALGMGLLSRRGTGPALAQGFQNVQANQLLQQQKQLRDAQIAKAAKPTYSLFTDASGTQRFYDPSNPAAGSQAIPGQAEASPGHWGKTPAGADAWYDPKGTPHSVGTPQTTIQMPEQKGETKFAEEAGKSVANRFADLSKEGDTARMDMSLITQLHDLGGDVNTGLSAAARGKLAEYGIKLGDNVGKIEAYNSIVDKMTPSQRVPGSGSSSDLDVKMFKSALPNLIRTSEGNSIIESTLAGLAQFKLDRAAIAEKALTGEISQKEAITQLRDMPNPFQKFKELQKGQFAPIPVGGSTIIDGVGIKRKN